MWWVVGSTGTEGVRKVSECWLFLPRVREGKGREGEVCGRIPHFIFGRGVFFLGTVQVGTYVRTLNIDAIFFPSWTRKIARPFILRIHVS